MADPALDPYGNVWPPSHWSNVLTQSNPALQPGLGVPTSVADAAIPSLAPQGVPDPQQVALAGMQPDASATPAPAANAPGDSVPPPGQFGEPEIDPVPAPEAPPTDPNAPGFFDSISNVGTSLHDAVLPPPTVQDITGPAAIGNSDPLAVTAQDHEAADKAEIDRVAALTPEQYAIEKDRHDQAAAAASHAAEMKAHLDDLNRTKANVDAHLAAVAKAQAASDQIQADALKLANTKVDPDQWMHSKSTPQKILLAISAIVGGLAAGRSGGRNVGLDIIQKSIDENIAAQSANLQNQWKGLEVRKGGVADQLARANDKYQADETVRLASWEYAKNQLLAEQANYDPRGTTALRIGGTIQQIHAKQAEVIQKFQQQQFENHIKLADVQQKALTAAEAVRHNQKDEALTGWGHAITAGANKEIARHNLADEADKLATRTAAKADKQDELVRKYSIGGSVEPVVDEKGQLVVDPKTGLPQTKHAALTQANGEPFLIANDEARNKLVNQKAATETIVNVLDQVRALRQEKGWSSDLVKSPEWQQMKAHWGKIVLTEAVANQLGAISKDDRELIDNLFATGDPSAVRDPLPGLETARKDALLTINNQLRAENYTGKDFDIPDMAKFAKAAPTEEDKVQQLIMGKTSVSGPNGGADISAGANPAQFSAIHDLASIAAGLPKERASGKAKVPNAAEQDRALKLLQNAADNAPDPKVKAAASAALAQVGLYSSSPYDSTVETAEGATPRAPVPPAPEAD